MEDAESDGKTAAPEQADSADLAEATEEADNAADSQEQGNTQAESADDTAAAPATSEAATSIPESYTVRKGDTLLKISRQIYGRDDEIDAICSLNGIEDSDRILEGQKLLLP